MSEIIKRVDARNSTDADGSSYYVTFCARESDNLVGKPGHAFVAWGIENGQLSMSIETAFGFYPDETDEYKAVFSTVPGQIANEAEKQKSSSLLTARMIVQVNKTPFYRSQDAIENWKTSDYDLYANNCLHFLHAVALDLGLFPPKVEKFELPSFYLEELIENTLESL